MGCASSSEIPASGTGVAGSVRIDKLHGAIRWNKEDDVAAMIKVDPTAIAKQNVNNGNTALHISAQNGHLPLIKMLLKATANKAELVNAQNANGQTALHMAMSYDLTEVVIVLKAAGADADIQNNEGFPAKFGLSGEKNPASSTFKLAALKAADTTASLLTALRKLEGCTDVDKAKLVETAMARKKEAKPEWTSDVQAALGAVMKSI